MPSLNLSTYLAIGIVLICAVWIIDHEHLRIKIESLETQQAQLQNSINAAASEAIEKVRQRDLEHAKTLADLSQQLYDIEAKNAQLENNRNAAIALGTQRVYVRADCPSNRGVPTASTAATGSNGGTAELDPAYRQTLSDLRRGAEQCAAQIVALQDYARAAQKLCSNE